jgi:hypothetical protein
MPGNNSARRQTGNSTVPSTVGRLGVDGFWMGDYGGGGPGRLPCWRTLKESFMGLGSVSLKINNQHTLCALAAVRIAAECPRLRQPSRSPARRPALACPLHRPADVPPALY